MGLFWPIPEVGHPGTPRLHEGGRGARGVDPQHPEPTAGLLFEGVDGGAREEAGAAVLAVDVEQDGRPVADCGVERSLSPALRRSERPRVIHASAVAARAHPAREAAKAVSPASIASAPLETAPEASPSAK